MGPVPPAPLWRRPVQPSETPQKPPRKRRQPKPAARLLWSRPGRPHRRCKGPRLNGPPRSTQQTRRSDGPPPTSPKPPPRRKPYLTCSHKSLPGSHGDRGRASELLALLPDLEAAAAEQSQRALAERAARSRLAERTSAVATLRRDLEVRATAVEERRALLRRRLAEVEQRLAGHVAERQEAAHRRVRLDAMASAIARLSLIVSARLATLEVTLSALREMRQAEAESLRFAADHLEALRRERSGVERQLSAVREQISRNELEEAQMKGRLEGLTETVRRELDCEPEALEGAECPPLPAGSSAPTRARELERENPPHGPGQPARPRGVRGPRRTAQVPRGPAP